MIKYNTKGVLLNRDELCVKHLEINEINLVDDNDNTIMTSKYYGNIRAHYDFKKFSEDNDFEYEKLPENIKYLSIKMNEQTYNGSKTQSNVIILPSYILHNKLKSIQNRSYVLFTGILPESINYVEDLSLYDYKNEHQILMINNINTVVLGVDNLINEEKNRKIGGMYCHQHKCDSYEYGDQIYYNPCLDLSTQILHHFICFKNSVNINNQHILSENIKTLVCKCLHDIALSNGLQNLYIVNWWNGNWVYKSSITSDTCNKFLSKIPKSVKKLVLLNDARYVSPEFEILKYAPKLEKLYVGTFGAQGILDLNNFRSNYRYSLDKLGDGDTCYIKLLNDFGYESYKCNNRNCKHIKLIEFHRINYSSSSDESTDTSESSYNETENDDLLNNNNEPINANESTDNISKNDLLELSNEIKSLRNKLDNFENKLNKILYNNKNQNIWNEIMNN